MPNYNDLRPSKEHEKRAYSQLFPEILELDRHRIIEGLLRLKDNLENQVPKRVDGKNLLVASWNIAGFGELGARLPEAYFYIAEVMAHFDLVIVQEVRRSRATLNVVDRLLGADWNYIINDVTLGAGRNSERMAFFYNRYRVKPHGVIGELDLWDAITAGEDDLSDTINLRQLRRMPLFVGFRADWMNFTLLGVHLNPGSSPAKRSVRSREVKYLLDALRKQKNQEWAENLIVAGDFNFYESHDSQNIQAFVDEGFFEPDGLNGQTTNVSGSERYDRMFVKKSKYLTLADVPGRMNGGVVRPFGAIYRSQDFENYRPFEGRDPAETENDARTYYERSFRKTQFSDHYPVWLELDIDASSEFLIGKRNELDI